MKLVVGLGNPGKDYNKTRHNVGFMYLDYLLGEDKFTLNKKLNAMEYIDSDLFDKIIFIKPLSYINLSGEVVIKYINYYKINIQDVLVIQDDLDIPIGKYKLMFNHGDGGHNGIKNIILNTDSREFLRLKIGISKDDKIDAKDYVLGKFSLKELKILDTTFESLKNFISDYININRDLLFGKYNSKN